MKMSSMSVPSRKGFTLIEVIAVLVLLGILAAVAVPRYIDLTAAASDRAIDAGIAELNGREALAWANEMLATPAGSVTDATILTAVTGGVNPLGADYVLVVGSPNTLSFKGGPAVDLTRSQATNTSPGRWSR